MSTSVPRVRIVTIEGNIGAGKSTLLAALQERLDNAILVKEPVDDWETIRDRDGTSMLEKFYADPSKNAFAFQMMAFISRLAILKNTVRLAAERVAAEGRDILVISERSLLTDRHVFAAMLRDMGHLSDVEYAIYTRWFAEFAEEFAVQHMVYLQMGPAACIRRIEKRARQGEGTIDIDYITNCDQYHERFVGATRAQNIPILTLRGEDATPGQWADRVMAFLAGAGGEARK